MTSQELSIQIRKESLQMVHDAGASHIGGALSMADILAVLYTDFIRINPKSPLEIERDRFILSKGHACTGLYSVLALRGFFPMEWLKDYSKDGSPLLSHVSHKVPGVELSTGSLGHGLPVGCGIALAGKLKNRNYRVYCLLSDGELDEGSNWEAFLFAAHHRLNNLIAIIDFNKIQSFGSVEEVMNLNPLNEKLHAFNWHVIEVNGHDHKDLHTAFSSAHKITDKPVVVICHTIKGKGVDFMENNLLWHYRPPSPEQLQHAFKQIAR